MAQAIRPAGGYTRPQRQLHWWVAGFVLLQLAVGFWLANTPGRHHAVVLAHAATGTLIFLLMFVRWRLRQEVGAPPPPAGTPPGIAGLAMANHFGYYALLLTMPIFGWLTLLSSGRTSHGLERIHAILGFTLLAAIAAHLLGVFYHMAIRHDGLLRRMLPGVIASGPAHPVAGE